MSNRNHFEVVNQFQESEWEITVLEANITVLQSNNLSVSEVERMLNSAFTKLTSTRSKYVTKIVTTRV